MSGQSVTAVIGGDWSHPLPSTTYGPPREKPKGLDWSKHRAPEPVAVEQPEATVTEIRERVSKPRREPNRCDCGAEISRAATRCRSCTAQQLATESRGKPRQPRTWATRRSVVDVPTARAEYLEGSTCPEIAARHDWPVISVRRQLTKAGVPMRDDRATRSGSRPKVYDPQLVAQVRRLYLDQGLSQVMTAQELGTTAKVVQHLMKREGIRARQGQSGGGDTLQGWRDRLNELGVTSAEIRVWANANGHVVGIRGVIPRHIVDAYEEAHQ